MPTVYTAIVAENDKVSLKEFALLCARGFSELIDMREEPMDAPIPEKLEPSGYYAERLEDAKAMYNEYMNNPPTDEGLELRYEAYVADEKARIESVKDEILKIKSRYYVMLEKVKAWQPPTEEHHGLKKFMIAQLTESMSHDCEVVYEPHIKTKEEYIEYEKYNYPKHLLEKIEYFEERVRKERERYAKINKWIDDLRNSL